MQRRILITSAVVACGAFAGPAAAGETCYPDWSVAAPLVKKEGLVTVEQLTPLAKGKLDGDIVKVTLCEEAGTYVYKLVVKDHRGNLKTVVVNAKNPF